MCWETSGLEKKLLQHLFLFLFTPAPIYPLVDFESRARLSIVFVISCFVLFHVDFVCLCMFPCSLFHVFEVLVETFVLRFGRSHSKERNIFPIVVATSVYLTFTLSCAPRQEAERCTSRNSNESYEYSSLWFFLPSLKCQLFLRLPGFSFFLFNVFYF